MGLRNHVLDEGPEPTTGKRWVHAVLATAIVLNRTQPIARNRGVTQQRCGHCPITLYIYFIGIPRSVSQSHALRLPRRDGTTKGEHSAVASADRDGC